VQNATNFREYLRGRLLTAADWTAFGAVDPSAMTLAGYEADSTREVWLSAGGSSIAPFFGGFTWNAADGDPGRANQEVYLKLLLDGSDGNLILLRATGTTAAPSGYALRIEPGLGAFKIQRWVGGTLTTISSVSKPFTAGGYAAFLLRANDTTLTARGWMANVVEPGGWDLTVTDSALSDGSLGLASDAFAVPGQILFFSYGTNGDSAPREAFIPAGIDSWASHEDQEIEITAEFETYDPDSGVTESLFLSTAGRRTSRSDFPSGRQMFPLLTDPGNLAATLTSDLAFGMDDSAGGFFSGQAGISLGSISFRNPMIQLGGRLQRFVDFLSRRTLAGRPVTVRAGLQSWRSHRWFEEVYTGTLAGEPESGDTVTCALAQPYRQLQNSLKVERNVGIETCLTASGAGIQAPVNAAYDLRSFAVVWRFRYPFGLPGTDSGMSKGLATTNEQFALFIEAHTGKIFARASCGGVASAIFIRTPAGVIDKDWHVAMLGVDGLNIAYLLVDGELIGQIRPPGLVDLPSTGIQLCLNNAGHSFCDARFYNFCPAVEDARAISAARAAADDPGVLSMWRCDDAAGNVVTDYGPLANHVTLTGTLGVNYFWDPSYLGQESAAGTPQPLAYGSVFNAPAPRADDARPIYRMADVDQSSVSSVIKARGAILSAGSDFTVNDNGTVTMTGAQSEPVTYDIDPGQTGSNLGAILEDALTRRAGFDDSSLDPDACKVVGQVLPFDCAFYSASEVTGADFLDRLLRPVGGHYRLDRGGRLLPGVLLPPITPGPYAGEPALELTGLDRSRVLFDGDYGGGFAGGFTLVWWALTYSTESRPELDTDPTPHRQTIALKGDGSTAGYHVSLYQPLQGAIRVALPGLSSATLVTGPGAVEWGVWTMGACRYDPAAGILSILSRPKGGALVTRATTSGVTGSVNLGTGALQLGGALGYGSVNGSVQRFQVWNSALSDAAIEALAVEAPAGAEAGLLFYPKITEGKGTAVTDLVSGDQGQVHGARWAPRAVFDFRKSFTKSTLTTKRLRPAWDAKVRYGVNQSPLTDADIADLLVTPAQRSALKRPDKTATAPAPEILAAYRDAVELGADQPLVTVLMNPSQAAKLARLLRYRLDPKRLMVRIDDAPRVALSLGLTDEIWAYHPDLPEEGAALRVVGFTPDLARVRFAIDGWGHPLDAVSGTRLVDEAGNVGLVDDSGSPGMVG
jgi:hypothetical protein